MTAKEALREIVDEMSEEVAEQVFPLLSGRTWSDGAPSEGQRLSNRELLELPQALRSLIIRHELSLLSKEELDVYVAEAEEWRHSDADALKHINDE